MINEHSEYEISEEERLQSDFPKKPDNLVRLSNDERAKLFGSFTYVPDEINPGMIRIVARKNFKIVNVDIPQLRENNIKGCLSGNVLFNEKGANQLKLLFQAWDNAGLISNILTFDGSYVPRFIRGSTSILSNHAYGTAFDINAQWNPLNKQPALIGSKGSVRELVEIASSYGFFWGGWFTNSDGMHFELNQILE